MNKIREYLNSSRSWYGNLSERAGALTDTPIYMSLKWTGESPFRLTIKREDTTNEPFPLFEVSGVLDIVDELTWEEIYLNNSSVVPGDIVDIGDPTLKTTRQFSACLNPGVPFPDLTGRVQVGPLCEGGEDEVAFSLTDLNPEPGPMFTVTFGGQSEGDVAYTGTIQQLYEYLLSQSGIEVVLLSRDLPDAVDPLSNV